MNTMNIERGVWLHDSGLSDADIRNAVAPALAVIREAGITPTEAFDAHLDALERDPLTDLCNSDEVRNSVWSRAEAAITAPMRESAVMVLA